MIKLTKELTFKLKNFEGDFKFFVGMWSAKLYYNTQTIKPTKKSFGKLIFNATNKDGNIEPINISNNYYKGAKVTTTQETIILEEPLSTIDIFLSFIPFIIFIIGFAAFGGLGGLIGGFLLGILAALNALIGVNYIRDATHDNIAKKIGVLCLIGLVSYAIELVFLIPALLIR